MGKNELVSKISYRTGIKKESCEAVVDAFAQEITDALVNGEKVIIKDFMSFEVTERAERTARNPATGGMQHFPAVKSVKCKVSKNIKDAVKKCGEE